MAPFLSYFFHVFLLQNVATTVAVEQCEQREDDSPSYIQKRVQAPDIAVKRREGPGKLHLLSHRSCSQNQFDECNQGFIKEMESIRLEADTAPEINERHLYTSLPDELMNDPRWQTHVKPGVRGRGYWFWKAALPRMLLSQGVFQLGDELLYVDADVKDMMHTIIRMRSLHPEDLILEAQPFCEHVWTKGDIFQRFGTTWDSLHYGLTQQPHTWAFLMRLNERTLKLLQIWEGLMTDFHLFQTNLPGTKPKTDDGYKKTVTTRASFP